MPSINSNTSAIYSINAARQTDRDMDKSMQRLSTGERITNAGDDAAGAAISDRMTANIKGIEQSILLETSRLEIVRFLKESFTISSFERLPCKMTVKFSV